MIFLTIFKGELMTPLKYIIYILDLKLQKPIYNMFEFTKPRNKSKPEILFYEIYKISEGDITQEIYDDDLLWKQFKSDIYKQFSVIGIFSLNENTYNDITHPSQQRIHPLKTPICPLGMCLCTQIGLNIHCVIENQITHKKCWVGSVCIYRFMPNLKKKLLKFLAKRRNDNKNNICLYCNEPMYDLRLKYQKDNLCDENCHEKYYHTIPFGKYKGCNMIDFIETEKGVNWFNWIKNTIYKDHNAFHQYNTLREIVDETYIDS